jgi:hypothetical protein
MSLNSSHSRLIVGWFGVVTVFVGISLASGMPMTGGYGLSLFTLGFLPPMIALAVFRGAPPRRVAEGIYNGEHSRHEVIERLRRIQGHDSAGR